MKEAISTNVRSAAMKPADALAQTPAEKRVDDFDWIYEAQRLCFLYEFINAIPRPDDSGGC